MHNISLMHGIDSIKHLDNHENLGIVIDGFSRFLEF